MAMTKRSAVAAGCVLALAALALATVGAEAAETEGLGFSFGGETECDYRPSKCKMGAGPQDPMACLNEGYSSPAVAKAAGLAADIGRNQPYDGPDEQTALTNSARALNKIWGQHADDGASIWLSFTVDRGAQYAIMNCKDPAKSDRAECGSGCGGCDRVFEVMDPKYFNDNEYRAYVIDANGNILSWDPVYTTSGNTFAPTQSDAYKAVMQAGHGEWVPYWKPDEDLATFAAPFFKF